MKPFEASKLPIKYKFILIIEIETKFYAYKYTIIRLQNKGKRHIILTDFSNI